MPRISIAIPMVTLLAIAAPAFAGSSTHQMTRERQIREATGGANSTQTEIGGFRRDRQITREIRHHEHRSSGEATSAHEPAR